MGHDKDHEGKCGCEEGKCGEGKCGGKKKGHDKAKEAKCGEGKCGEGKCGGDAKNMNDAKAEKEGLKIDFEVADAMNLPYENDRFDISSIAFGIRNVDDPVVALKELARVVKPGGRVVVLEFGQPKGLLKIPYNLYSQHIMPAVGGLLSGNREAYTYLPRTSATFPAGKKFLKLMKNSKSFSETKAIKLTGGIAYVYVGIVQ
jgi:demethylmenaquinone methyltransferase/2-methoxy-6-polyprenyl-1,4-benzoquinol methylase